MQVNFDIYNKDAVDRLREENPDILPTYSVDSDADLAYNKSQINGAIESAIIQGKSIDHISDDLQKRMESVNRSSAIRTARTATTCAQNAGNLDSFYKAQEMGIATEKQWVCTQDDRTRESHLELDGEHVPLDEEFSNGLQYPGDPSGDPSEVYNCRCTMVAYFPETDSSTAEEEESEEEYEEWYEEEREEEYEEWYEEESEEEYEESYDDEQEIEEEELEEEYEEWYDDEQEVEEEESEQDYEDWPEEKRQISAYVSNSSESKIEDRNTARGKSSAITHFDAELNTRQEKILKELPEEGSRATVKKNKVNMSDLSALTAKTGVEFAMFTKSEERLIVRGAETYVNITVSEAKEMAAKGYKWSGHTHPGVGRNVLQPSTGDYEILKCFNQKFSVIYNSLGEFQTFEND